MQNVAVVDQCVSTETADRWENRAMSRFPLKQTTKRMKGKQEERKKEMRVGDTFGSMILRYLTWIPLVVKYGISNLTLIGLLPLPPGPPAPPILPPNPPIIPPPCSSSPFTEGRPSSARMRNSLPPPNCLIFHTMADLSGA